MYGWMWTYSNGWLPRPTKSTERALTCQTSHTHIFAQGRIISQVGWGGVARRAFNSNPLATRDSLQSPAFGSRKRARGASRLGSPTPDSSLCLIYDPRGETKFPCPPQTAQTNETDALFIIAGAKTRSESRGSGFKKKKKITEKL